MPCEDCAPEVFIKEEPKFEEEDVELDEVASQNCEGNSGCIIVFAEKGSKVIINAKDVEAEEESN